MSPTVLTMSNSFTERLAQYRNLLSECKGSKCEKVFEQIADRYEDDLLEIQGFPDDYFKLVTDLLSNESFYSKPGVWNFLAVLGTEQGRLQPAHYDALAECIVLNLNTDLCVAVCDFIARNYPATRARGIFSRLATVEEKKPEALHGFVKDGLRILAAEERRARTSH
jgi:hypothetical protein